MWSLHNQRFINPLFVSENGTPNPFSPLPPPAIADSAYNDGGYVHIVSDRFEGTTITTSYELSYLEEDDHIIIDATEPVCTPPLVLREDLFDVYEITQQEFLDSIQGWNPTPINRRLN